MAKTMVFACQADSFLKEYESKVLSCKASQFNNIINGRKTVQNCYEVILEDTILFPEGGGQPCDQGFLDGIKVLRVDRHGTDAVHYTESPLPVGKIVKETLDWNRRLDHMQQHSGQHLITALADHEFGYSTSSWWLGEQLSYIQLDTPNMDTTELNKLEQLVNEKIREALPVTVQVYEEGDTQLTSVRTRGLPDDHKGSVRVVAIQGIESNMCCGTHVTNLSQLQVIKLLYVKKGKKNQTNLHFLCGGRVLDQFTSCLEREQSFTTILKGGPSDHIHLAQKLQSTVKISKKNLHAVLADLAVVLAKHIKSLNPVPKYYSYHKKEADSDFMRTLVNEVGECGILLFLTVGDEKGVGEMVLFGPSESVNYLSPRVCTMLGGKGVCSGTKFQAKVSEMNHRCEAEEFICKYFMELETK